MDMNDYVYQDLMEELRERRIDAIKMNDRISQLLGDIEQLRKERDDAFVDQALIEELWERRTDATEMREHIKLLRKERDELRQQIETIKNGFEGCCYACETVGEMNKKLLAERDDARREICELSSRDSGELDLYASNKEAKRRDWDCFDTKKEETL